jgi:hypothetical protein
MEQSRTPLEMELLKVIKNYVEFVQGRLDADMLLVDVNLDIVLQYPDFGTLYYQLPGWIKRHIERVTAMRKGGAVEWPMLEHQPQRRA